MRISTNEAKTWSQPKKCINTTGYYVLNNDRVIQLKTGRILFSVALHKTPETEWSNGGKIFCYYSDDEGETWHQSKQILNPENILLQEPGLIELTDRSIMMFCRTNTGVQFLSFSEDSGKHWTPVEASKINSPQSPASIERIPSTGDLLLVWNDNFEPGGGKRTPFNLAISKDEGKTWKKTKTIESDPRGWYCYTAIDFFDDFVLLGHCAGDREKYNGLETTQITRLSLDWVYSDATPDPFVLSDSNGVVKLGCQVKNANIHYTLDGSQPTELSDQYFKPIHVSKTTLLQMQAKEHSKVPSKVVTVSVGVDVFQDAKNVEQELVPGLSYSYYEGSFNRVADIKKIPPVESGTLSRFSIEKRKRDENFAFIFEGYIKIPKDGIYTFYVISNDGSVLYLNNDEFINNDGPHASREESNAMALRVGKHKIELKYFQMGGGQQLTVLWSGPGFERIEIPASALFYCKK